MKLVSVGIDPDLIGFVIELINVICSKSDLLVLPPDTTQNNPTFYLQFSFSLVFLFSVLANFREHIFLAPTSISALFKNIIAHIYKIMKKSNYVVWPTPSSKFVKMARGPKSLATPALHRESLCNLTSLSGPILCS